ncbi:MAG: T9SS type A sorting domain-containing protein [Chitinophagales bacterium]
MKKIYSLLLIVVSLLSVNLINAQTVWINEIHYDNAGADVDEGIEIAGMAGTDLSCYALMLYNGSDNELYGTNDSIVLSGTIDDEGCGFGAVWFGLPSNGLQNGSPDGIGLWNHCTNTVVQFLSYEGVITAGDGPMIGLTSEDIGVFESTSAPVGGSLQLTGSGSTYADFSWDSLGVHTNGDLNTNQNFCGPQINLQTSSFTIGEGAGTTPVTNLIINPVSASATSVEIHLTGGTGDASDLDLTAWGGSFPVTVPITAGSDTLFVPVTPNDDAVYEGTETLQFTLRNPGTGLTLGPDSVFTLTITDNELPPDTTVSANPNFVSANESDGTVDLSFDISQLSATGTTFTADVALVSGNAADLGNYTTQTVSFTSTGATTQNVTVSITDNAVVDGDRTYVFQLTNLSAGLTLGTNEFDTLVVMDDDAPTYSIATLTTLDANGNPDSLGVAVELDVVVMGINYGDAPDVNFFIHDGTGGMGVFSNNNFGYTVNEGDQINIRGEVGFYNGLTQLVNLDTIFITGTGTLPAVATVTTLDESTEGELVKLENVTVVDQTDWNTGVGAGFNVDVTDGTNTYSVRIDKSADLYSMTLPGCVLDVTGIGSQFDNSSPYTSGYQLLPRYTADITVIQACVTPTYTIADATEVDTNGDAVLNGVDMVLKGIVTSPDFRANQNGVEFTFADNTGGIWAYTSDSLTGFGFTPTVGDSVVVYGNIGTSSGANRIYIDSVASLGAATPFTPVVVTVALDEIHEAELIKIENLTLNGTWQSSGGSYNVSATSDGGITYDIRVDADRAELYSVPLTSSNKFNLTGVGAQYDPSAPRTDGYQIMPRFASDIEIVSAIKDITLNNLTISPVPAKDKLTIAFDYDANETATISIVDVMGRTVLTHGVALANGLNTNTLNVASLTTGFYVVKIQTAKGVSTSNITIK